MCSLERARLPLTVSHAALIGLRRSAATVTAMPETKNPVTVEDGAGSLASEGESVHELNARLRYEWLAAVMDGNIARDIGDAEAARDADARRDAVQDDFFARNRRLAMAAAKSFLTHARGEDLRDHEQAALLGLWEAFIGTDPVKGRTVRFAEDGRLVAEAGWDPEKATFGTLSRSYVKGKVRRSVATVESGLSYALWTYRPKVLEARAKLTEERGQTPTVRDIAAACDLPYETVQAVLTPTAASLDKPLGEDGGTLGDLLAQQPDAGLDLSAEDVESVSQVLRLVAPRMGTLDLLGFVLRNGLVGRPSLSVVDTAARLGVRRGTVASGEARAATMVSGSMQLMAWYLALLGLGHRNLKALHFAVVSGAAQALLDELHKHSSAKQKTCKVCAPAPAVVPA